MNQNVAPQEVIKSKRKTARKGKKNKGTVKVSKKLTKRQ